MRLHVTRQTFIGVDVQPQVARAPEDHGLATVAILLATFNGARFLGEQLESIAEQTHRHWSLVISDDGSVDETLSIAEDFASRHPGRVRILQSAPTQSASGNFFRLLREAPIADYVALCDQDDVWIPTKLERLVEALSDLNSDGMESEALVAYSDLAVVDSRLETIAVSFMGQMRTDPFKVTFFSTLVENSVPGCSMLLSRHTIDLFRSFEGSLKQAIMHDWWLLLIAQGFGRAVFVPEPLVLYRQHESNTLGSVNRGGVRFVLSKLFDTRRDTQKAIRAQTELFFTAYGRHLPASKAVPLKEFRDSCDRQKIVRMWACIRLGILKQTWPRRIFQLARI